MSTRRFVPLGMLCCILFLRDTPTSAAPAGPCLNADLNSTADDFLEVPDFTGFGRVVSIHGDTAMVGLPAYVNPETEPRQRGRVAVFTCDRQTRTWARTASLNPLDQADVEGSFGAAIVLRADRSAVAASNAVRLYEERAGEWRPVLKLTSNGIDDFIEPTMAYDPPYLAFIRSKLVGEEVTRAIEIYRVRKGWHAVLEARLRPPEDFSELNLQNRTLLAGLHVYVKRAGEWRLEQKLAPDQAPPHEDFGSPVVLHGNVVLVGSPREGGIVLDDGPRDRGAVYVFERRKKGWQQVQRVQPEPGIAAFDVFGSTLAFNGKFAAVGSGAYGGFQREFGPVFLYRVENGGLVFDRTLDLIASAMDMSRSHLIVGRNTNVQGLPQTGATILRLPRPQDAEAPEVEK